MNIGRTILALATLASATLFAKGIYLVSGGDFRPPRIKYILQTDEDN